MSTTQPEESAPLPAGYAPGDYVPFKDRDPSNPSSIAGQWADPAREVQLGGAKLSADEEFRAIYGTEVRKRASRYAGWLRRVAGRLVDGLVTVFAAVPLIAGWVMRVQEMDLRTDPVTGQVVSGPNTEASATSGLLLLFGSI